MSTSGITNVLRTVGDALWHNASPQGKALALASTATALALGAIYAYYDPQATSTPPTPQSQAPTAPAVTSTTPLRTEEQTASERVEQEARMWELALVNKGQILVSGFPAPPTLVELNLSKHRLGTGREIILILAEALATLSMLRILDLSDNQISGENLSLVLSKLPKQEMMHLNLSGNSLVSFMPNRNPQVVPTLSPRIYEYLGKLKALTYLNLSHTDIDGNVARTMPLGVLTALVHLNLSKNPLCQSVTRSSNNNEQHIAPDIDELGLHGGGVRQLLKSLARLPRLTHLNLSAIHLSREALSDIMDPLEGVLREHPDLREVAVGRVYVLWGPSQDTILNIKSPLLALSQLTHLDLSETDYLLDSTTLQDYLLPLVVANQALRELLFTVRSEEANKVKKEIDALLIPRKNLYMMSRSLRTRCLDVVGSVRYCPRQNLS